MLYCISYDIKSPSHEEVFLKRLKELGKTNQFLSNGRFLDSEKSREDIYDILRATLDAPDLLFICDTSLGQMSGWLPGSSVEWLREH